MSTFRKSLTAFKKASPWLGPEHEPEVTALEFLAKALDTDPPANPAPLISQWGLLLRSLRKDAPEVSALDPLDELLTRGE